jgi:acyl-[acyl-carrier-protein]-phospholipid O-acyltransferase/long-chain-fatty-acid--[acyl-carrier-protein] ligase
MNTLHVQFVANAKKYPDKLAFIDRTAGRRITYSRALIASLMLADHFKRYAPGVMGIMMPTTAGCGLVSIGALMSGRTPVMINYTGDAAANAEYAQRKCDFETIVTSRALLEKLNCRTVEGMVFIEDIMKAFGPVRKLKAALKSRLPMPALMATIKKGSLDDNAVILFTSGSEKDPKGVQLTHRNIGSNVSCVAERFDLSDKDVFLASLPFFHVFGLTTNFWLPMWYGMTIVSYASPIEYRSVCDVIRDERPTIVTGTPSFMWGYVRKSEPGDFAGVRYAIVGADKCPDALRAAFKEKHGIDLYEGYGATETSPVISANGPGVSRPGSVGRPVRGVKVRIEHHETGEDCAAGEIGRILVKGDLVMKGYFDDFEETALHIRHGWYDTGDMGYMDEDGYLWHVGRLRRFLKVGGEMVSLVRVENVLEHLLPEGVECCVVEVPDAIKGSRVVAAVTAPVDEKAVLKLMAKDLPNIALPWKFVVIEELPKMGSGKIDFRTTTEMVRDILHQRGHR